MGESFRRRREKKAERQRALLLKIDEALAEYEAVCVEHKLRTAQSK